MVIWLFALSAAYPFLPGANSLAFKGISVFFGLMLTLGSTGVMTHAMSGLVLIYSRALRKGDWIRLADNEGQVSEIGVLATKILTRENYIVTVPNAVVVSGKIINLSAESADGGVNLTTSVTIGYDTPWRQVHALLELAARRTPGIDQQIAPVVRKLGLLDWYTSYELQVRLLPTTKLPDGRNALHSSIIDVFNEFGVQIMSPNFVMQPKAAVVSLGVIRDLSLSIVASLPGLMIVVLIFLLTWLIIRLVKVVLDQVAAGRIQVPGIHPETVSATRRLISVVIWLFALSAAYPFLPGANSLAFKGISVFFGLMLTLGSTGVMTHAMSGLVLIYSRALRKGDWIRLADNEGQVSEIGVLATKILTRENYIVTVPNAVVVSGKIINLSAESADGGVNLTTSVTIGYDTPWRQVHAMLELAARRTPGIDQQIAPVVRKLGLLDWYTSYELQVRLLPTTKLPDGRNALHSSIIDVFNEFGVQIMSPNFVMQPKAAVVVPQEAWYAAPAVAPQEPEK
ncbi:transporter small conductance mechanosensitive ion channel (MscS) family [Klebsiella pneumoniae]|nr:transporter small conductance mechanosensitive ion channel (MscS) family [Klebsiella pneumoniae]